MSVSAGNYGLTSTGAPVLGGITSPGNSPVAITVGALDTNGTLDPSDDDGRAVQLARSGALRDRRQARRRRARARASCRSKRRTRTSAAHYSQYHIAGSGKNAYMRLSGSSMSTAVVSGGIALLLNAQPSMTPAQVKIAIQMGARFMPNDGLIGARRGQRELRAVAEDRAQRPPRTTC